MSGDKHTRESLIEAAKRAAAESGGVLSRRDFSLRTGIKMHQIYALFPEGGWKEVLRLAGIAPHPDQNDPISDDEALAEFHRVATAVGKIPTWFVFDARANVSSSLLKRRFGAFDGTLERYRAWLETNAPESPLLAVLLSRVERGEPPQPSAPTPTLGRTEWSKAAGVEYGAPINFRGLRHAPINEQGVVFLFGMVSDELGFLVEAVHAAYPDCEAKRCVDRKADRWQRVHIEFEFRSRNFRDHGHDPAKCDVIVCWEHDWPECPLEVVELRRVLDDLKQ